MESIIDFQHKLEQLSNFLRTVNGTQNFDLRTDLTI